MKRKLRVAVLFGGKSAEHEISLISARNIVEAMDKKKYNIVAIGIDKDGRWFLDERARLLGAQGRAQIARLRQGDRTAVVPGADHRSLIRVLPPRGLGGVDVVFPVLHGPFGEDGTVQGLLKTANIPFVGAGILGSAVGMDKDVMKRLLRDAKIPTANFLVFQRNSVKHTNFARVTRTLGLPLFVKPANLGSSVGISKIQDRRQFNAAVKQALRFDDKILVEEFIRGREIECAVLGNENPVASLPGEIITHHDFYSYDAKYIDENGAQLLIPAKLSPGAVRAVRQLAIQTFEALCCEGMARVDFFLRSDGSVLVNEINTIPGFTKISMYPKLWEASGIPYSRLIDRLIQLALERFRKDQNLRNSI
jgi:D-alanine-D-alanine ligase